MMAVRARRRPHGRFFVTAFAFRLGLPLRLALRKSPWHAVHALLAAVVWVVPQPVDETVRLLLRLDVLTKPDVPVQQFADRTTTLPELFVAATGRGNLDQRQLRAQGGLGVGPERIAGANLPNLAAGLRGRRFRLFRLNAPFFVRKDRQ